MDRGTAIKQLQKLLGKKMGYRVDPKAPKQDERDEAKAALGPAIKYRDAVQAQLEARRTELLEADVTYQSLKAERRAAGNEVNRLGELSRHYKITVGTLGGVSGITFFNVAAEGDSWEQVIAKVKGDRK